MTRLIYLIVLVLIGLTSMAASPSIEQIMTARASIGDCFNNYKNVLASREIIEKKRIKPPHRKQKKLLKEIDLQVFDQLVEQFVSFFGENTRVMTAPSGEKMKELLMAYSSNCSRFTNGIEMFVKFATGKKVPHDFVRYFKHERSLLMEEGVPF